MRWSTLALFLPLVSGQHVLRKRARHNDAPPSDDTVPETIDMPIDHFDKSNKNTYKNFFWVNSTFYQQGGPVIVYDNGEGGVDDGTIMDVFNINDTNSAAMGLAQRYNGLAVIWEHRFYGQSQPFHVDNATGLPTDPAGSYKYLTTEQALEDVIYFANHFAPDGLKEFWPALNPQKAPWIFMGGSYPGARAAMLRVRNPETIYASWASSAPVQATTDMTTYWEQVYQDMNANCSADFAAASSYLDSELKSGSAHSSGLAKWLISLSTIQVTTLSDVMTQSDSQFTAQIANATTISDITSANGILDILMSSMFQSSGFNDETSGYCDLMEAYDPTKFLSNSSVADTLDVLFGETSNTSSITPLDQGIAAKYGPKAAFGAVLYATALHSLYSQYTDYSSPDDQNAQPKPDDNAWSYQTCTEYGYWMVANTSSPDNLLSGYIDLDTWQTMNCGSNSTFKALSLPQRPDNSLPNKYGGWHMKPANTMFTNGMKDPWFTVSAQSTHTEIGAPNRTTVQDIPKCNEAPAGDNVFGLLYPNNYHASDLDTTPESGEALDLFSRALDVWLPCFNTSRSTTSKENAASHIIGGNLMGVVAFAAISCLYLAF